MKVVIARREAIRRLAVLSSWLAVPAVLGHVACSRKASCLDVSGLSPDEVRMRQEVAAYRETSDDASKKCRACVQWTAGAPNACGGCKVVKGPIDADGSCKLFVARPT